MISAIFGNDIPAKCKAQKIKTCCEVGRKKSGGMCWPHKFKMRIAKRKKSTRVWMREESLKNYQKVKTCCESCRKKS